MLILKEMVKILKRYLFTKKYGNLFKGAILFGQPCIGIIIMIIIISVVRIIIIVVVIISLLLSF